MHNGLWSFFVKSISRNFREIDFTEKLSFSNSIQFLKIDLGVRVDCLFSKKMCKMIYYLEGFLWKPIATTSFVRLGSKNWISLDGFCVQSRSRLMPGHAEGGWIWISTVPSRYLSTYLTIGKEKFYKNKHMNIMPLAS